MTVAVDTKVAALRDYQERAVRFLLESPGGGALWDMYMSTGKTPTALVTLERVGARRALVLPPKSVVDTWVDHAPRWLARGWKVVALGKDAGTGKKKAERLRSALDAGHERILAVANHHALLSADLRDLVESVAWDALVVDESHRMKDPDGKLSGMVASIARATRWRVALTGTPTPKDRLDWWAQLRIVDQAVLGWNFFGFKSRYADVRMRGHEKRDATGALLLDAEGRPRICREGEIVLGRDGKPRVDEAGRPLRAMRPYPDVVGWKNEQELADKLSRVVFHVERSVVALPPSQDVAVKVELDAPTRKAYREMEREMRTRLGDGEARARTPLVRDLRLQQIASGYATARLDDGGYEPRRVGREKMDALEELLDATDAAEPWVLFCLFRPDMVACHEVARALGRASLELSGSRNELAAWQRGEAPVLVVQEAAGGVGVNLSRAGFGCFYSMGYDAGLWEQCRSRLVRTDRVGPVALYHLVAKDTIEEDVWEVIEDKVDDAAEMTRRIVAAAAKRLTAEGATAR